MAWYNKSRKVEVTAETTTPIDSTTIPKPEEEWVWVEGYKGVDENMQGYDGFQYEINIEYSVDGEVIVCRNGLHFSLNLKDAFKYKDCFSDRFFKVKAYVRKRDLDRYGRYDLYSLSATRSDKLAAQKIILTEEITNTAEMVGTICEMYPIIETISDLKQVKMLGYEKFKNNKCKEKLSKYFSELFAEIFVDKQSYNLVSKTNELVAYMEEGISKDVAIYLVMK